MQAEAREVCWGEQTTRTSIPQAENMLFCRSVCAVNESMVRVEWLKMITGRGLAGLPPAGLWAGFLHVGCI